MGDKRVVKPALQIMIVSQNPLKVVEGEVFEREHPHPNEVKKIKAILLKGFIVSMSLLCAVVVAVVLKLLKGLNVGFLADITVFVSISLFIFLLLSFQDCIALNHIVPQRFVYPQFLYVRNRAFQDIGLPEHEVKELLHKELTHLEGFGLAFPLRIEVDILGDWVDVGQFLLARRAHFLKDLHQRTEMDLYPLVYAFEVCFLAQDCIPACVCLLGVRISKRQLRVSLEFGPS